MTIVLLNILSRCDDTRKPLLESDFAGRFITEAYQLRIAQQTDTPFIINGHTVDYLNKTGILIERGNIDVSQAVDLNGDLYFMSFLVKWSQSDGAWHFVATERDNHFIAFPAAVGSEWYNDIAEAFRQDEFDFVHAGNYALAKQRFTMDTGGVIVGELYRNETDRSSGSFMTGLYFRGLMAIVDFSARGAASVYAVVGAQIDLTTYTAQTEICGIAVMFACCFGWICWAATLAWLESPGVFHKVSYHALLLCSAGDTEFVLAMFSLGLGLDSRMLFFCPAIVMAAADLFLGLTAATRGWAATLDDDLDNNRRLCKTALFLGEFLALIIGMSMAELWWSYGGWLRWLFVFIWCSPPLVQILRAAIGNLRPKEGIFFFLFWLASRLTIVLYFGFDKFSVLGEYFPFQGALFTAWIVFLGLVIVLQGVYGGCFFLPKKWRPGFRYQFDGDPQGANCCICLSELVQDEELMRTPCNHIFHGVCLREWLDRGELICPLCRTPMPPLEED